MSDEQQTQQADDPSGDGWRWVCQGEKLELHDMMRADGEWWPTKNAGGVCSKDGMYRRRIEQQPEQADDPSGDGWRDVGPDEILQTGDMYWVVDHWEATQSVGAKSSIYGNGYRRRIEPPQPSDSEPETIEDLRRQLAACEMLLAEAGGSGEQLNAELQQLKEQVATLTRERDRYRNQLAGAIEHSKAPEAQAQLVDRLQKWLRPVLEVVAENPEDASLLAVAVLGSLPQIASRLIEE